MPDFFEKNSDIIQHNVVKIAGFSRLWGRIMKIMLTEILPSGKAEMFTTLCKQMCRISGKIIFIIFPPSVSERKNYENNFSRNSADLVHNVSDFFFANF